MTIAILYTLPTKRVIKSTYLVADEDTVLSAQKIALSLSAKGVTPLLVALSEDHISETIRSIQADLIINLIDWTGADLPLSLDAMDELTKRSIPFVGATKENFTLVDKVTMKESLDRHHLPTAKWQIFRTGKEHVSKDLTYPVLVKLAREHCSVGIEKTSFVTKEEDLLPVVVDRLERFSQDVYVEEFINGREFQITVLEDESGPYMLPPAEIIYKPTDIPEFLTFSERWNIHDPHYQRSDTALAQLSQKQLDLFSELSKKTFIALGFRDFTRIDVRLKSEFECLILEANPNPGLDDDELYSMTISARAAGLTFSDFLWRIITSALKRKGQTVSTFES